MDELNADSAELLQNVQLPIVEYWKSPPDPTLPVLNLDDFVNADIGWTGVIWD